MTVRELREALQSFSSYIDDDAQVILWANDSEWSHASGVAVKSADLGRATERTLAITCDELPNNDDGDDAEANRLRRIIGEALSTLEEA